MAKLKTSYFPDDNSITQPWLAKGGDQPIASPVHKLQSEVEATFDRFQCSPDPVLELSLDSEDKKYPAWIRVSIVVIPSTIFWIGIVIALRHLL